MAWSLGFEPRTSVCVLALAFPGCVTLDDYLILSYPHLQNEGNHSPLTAWC